MKKFSLLWLSVALFVMPSWGLADNELLWEKRLPFNDATIHYVMKGAEEGRETLFIRDSGKERAIYRETVSSMNGMNVVNSTITIKNPDYIYSYDLQKKQGLKAVNPQKYMVDEYNKLSPAEQKKVRENAKKIGTDYTDGMGGSMQPNALEILGYNCDKVEIKAGSDTYLIHDTDVILKMEMNIMGMQLITVAESINMGQVDDKYFQHPVGITAEVNTQSDEIAKDMATQAIAMLKDSEGSKKVGMMAAKPISDGAEQMSQEAMVEVMQQMELMVKGLPGKAAQ